MWRNIRRAVSSAVKSVERKVRASIQNPQSLFRLAAVVVSAYLTWGATSAIFGAEGIGTIVSSTLTAGVKAYNTYDNYSSLPIGTSGGSGGHFTDGGTAISASSSGGGRENIGNGLAYLASPGYGLYRDYKKWRETHSVEEHGTLPQMIGKSLGIDRLILLLGSGAKRIDDFKKGKRKRSNRAHGKEQVDRIANELNMNQTQRQEFHSQISSFKNDVGRGGDANYDIEELREIGEHFMEFYGKKFK